MVDEANESAAESRAYSLDTVFSCLASRERRQLVQQLSALAPASVSTEVLAAAFAARTHGTSRDEVTDDQRQAAAQALHHEHLPRLAAAGLVDYDADVDSVTLAEHPVLADSGFREAIGGDAPGSAESLDALFDALADERRRTILDVLGHQAGRIHVETLARELAAREQGVFEAEVPAAAVDRRLIELHHSDLPPLAEAGLVDHDPRAERVEYTGHPTLSVAWIHSVLQPEFPERLDGELEAVEPDAPL